MVSLYFRPDSLVWCQCHYLSSVSHELKSKVGLLKKLVVLRADRNRSDFILSDKQIDYLSDINYLHCVYRVTLAAFVVFDL